MISSAAIENIRSATYISDAFVFMNKDIEAFNLMAAAYLIINTIIVPIWW